METPGLKIIIIIIIILIIIIIIKNFHSMCEAMTYNRTLQYKIPRA